MTLPADTIAVVVGIEEYQAGRAWRLDGPALDACRFARWLTIRGVPADRITLLVSPLRENADAVMQQSQGYRVADADHVTVRDIFTRYLPSNTSGLLVFYWGGHGVIEQEERRLIYADASTLDKRNLNLSSLLKSMRSSIFVGHPKQLGLVDACLNLVTELGWEGTMPNEEFATGRAETQRDQRILLAASPGERAVNLDGLKTGLFSQVLREALDSLAADVWPPDADRLRDFVQERFHQLRDEHRTRQVPSYLWFRSHSGDEALVFRSGFHTEQAGFPTAGHEIGPDSPVPAQLPHGLPDFTGREAELDRLHGLLSGKGGAGPALVIVAITGMAGVGKTALAVHWVHQIRERFPDGQLYVNLRGFDPTGSAMEPAEAIRGFLDAFAVPPLRIPVSFEAQAALYRSLLADRRVLIMLDNASGADQVRPLLPGSPGCLVVLTSRYQSSGLTMEGAHLLAVDLLSPAEAQQLLARRLGLARVVAEPEAVDNIVAICSRLPLALAIVAARAATHPGFALTVLARELREAKGSLDAFDAEDQSTDVRAVFSWSYRRLTAAASNLFRLLGLHPAPEIGAPAAASLAGIPLAEVRPVLAELARTNLAAERIPGRFVLHDLLRAYATELTNTQDSAANRRAAVERLLDHYLHTAYSADSLLNPHRDDRITLAPPRPGVTPEMFVDHGNALTWFQVEQPVLLAAVEQAVKTGFDTHIWQLAWTLATFFDYQGHWHDEAMTQLAALGATRRLADRPQQAASHRFVARAYVYLGRYVDADAHLQHALDIYAELGDDTGQAQIYRVISGVLDRQNRYREALPHAQRALELFRATGDQIGEARALNAVGWYHSQLGDHWQALACCEQALHLQQEIGDRSSQAETWDSLGFAHRHLGQLRRAYECYQRALDLFREFGDRYNEADTLAYLGDAYLAAGDANAARNAWRLAVTILDEFHHPTAEQIRTKLSELDNPG